MQQMTTQLKKKHQKRSINRVPRYSILWPLMFSIPSPGYFTNNNAGRGQAHSGFWSEPKYLLVGFRKFVTLGRVHAVAAEACETSQRI